MDQDLPLYTVPYVEHNPELGPSMCWVAHLKVEIRTHRLPDGSSPVSDPFRFYPDREHASQALAHEPRHQQKCVCNRCKPEI